MIGGIHIKKFCCWFLSVILGVIVLMIPYLEGIYVAQNDGINLFVSIILGTITLCLADLKNYIFRKSL